jgi:hypothetical protein
MLSLVYLDLELFENRDGAFLNALSETDVFSNLRALKFSTLLHHDDDGRKKVLLVA